MDAEYDLKYQTNELIGGARYLPTELPSSVEDQTKRLQGFDHIGNPLVPRRRTPAKYGTNACNAQQPLSVEADSVNWNSFNLPFGKSSTRNAQKQVKQTTTTTPTPTTTTLNDEIQNLAERIESVKLATQLGVPEMLNRNCDASNMAELYSPNTTKQLFPTDASQQLMPAEMQEQSSQSLLIVKLTPQKQILELLSKLPALPTPVQGAASLSSLSSLVSQKKSYKRCFRVKPYSKYCIGNKGKRKNAAENVDDEMTKYK